MARCVCPELQVFSQIVEALNTFNSYWTDKIFDFLPIVIIFTGPTYFLPVMAKGQVSYADWTRY